MDARYTIAIARSRDIPALASIERAAAAIFEDRVPAALFAQTVGEEDLRDAQADGRLWVALENDAPIGFALVAVLAPGRPHLEEVDVHPDHGRRGVGAALVRAVLEWAARSGQRELTLTTFREFAWNAPFYARLGFDEIAATDLDPLLAALVRDEASRGLDPARRVVMRRRVG
jgi:GNAT superfamily N-acetyltransferase